MSAAHAEMLDAYFRLMNLNGASHVYRIAKRARVLDALAERPATAAEVAQRCALQESPTRLVLEALAALKLIVLSDDRYSLTPLARMLLGGSYENLGDEYWEYLPTFLATGQPLKRMDDVAQSESHYRSQVSALAWMSAAAAEAAAQAMDIGGARKDLNILDVGAGSAVWSLAMARRDRGTRITAVDWPAVLDVARSTAQQQGLSDRLQLLPGNVHTVELPAQYFDLAIVANLTHLLTPEANAALFAKVQRALKPSGEIAVIDVISNQTAGELSYALYALGLALRTASGRVYPAGELSELLTASGFARPAIIPLPVPPFVFSVLLSSVER